MSSKRLVFADFDDVCLGFLRKHVGDESFFILLLLLLSLLLLSLFFIRTCLCFGGKASATVEEISNRGTSTCVHSEAFIKHFCKKRDLQPIRSPTGHILARIFLG